MSHPIFIEPTDIYAQKERNGCWDIFVGQKRVCQVSSKPTAEGHVLTLRGTIIQTLLDRREKFPHHTCEECGESCDYENYDPKTGLYHFFCGECGRDRATDTFSWL